MNEIVLLWSVAVYLGAVFAAAVIHVTLTPKHKTSVVIGVWSVVAVVGFVFTCCNYMISIVSDVIATFGLLLLIFVPVFYLYKGTSSTKVFVILTANLIANVVTFLFCGTTDSLVAPMLGLMKESPYEVSNLLFFIGVKLVVFPVVFILYKKFLLSKFTDMIDAMSGKMGNFILAPAISYIGFYIITIFTNFNGIFPNNIWFFPLYLTICTIFVIEFYLLFYAVLWSSRAMKNAAELNVATNIQASMLPCIFPAFPERDEFNIYASMTPAKEVGGDFYDFFLVDEEHLAMVMADVSGKGVPAALFMVIAKTLIKNAAQIGLSPKEVLEKVNNQLCENNEAEMFVTVWLGILNIQTGDMVCANAGHEYPAIRRQGGKFELFKDRHGFVLAGMECSKYREYEMHLDKGDTLFVYTDGVPEATNASNELFANDRMIEALNKKDDSTSEEILMHVKESVDEFVGHAPQFDDLTMLAIQMNE